MSDRLQLSQRYESVPRVYIECLRDQTISLEQQRSLHAATPCQRIYALNTSHSPFFSAPGDLSRILTALA
jgi:hypothetical protein